jgi:anthranilate phosphoribosyltransferase
VGGSPAENAVITRAILEGKPGPQRDAVLLNSAAAIHIARPALSLDDALQLARETIDSGKALAQLERFIALSNGKSAATVSPKA